MADSPRRRYLGNGTSLCSQALVRSCKKEVGEKIFIPEFALGSTSLVFYTIPPKRCYINALCHVVCVDLLVLLWDDWQVILFIYSQSRPFGGK